MTGKRKTTASVSSVGADGKQPIMKNHTKIIANEQQKTICKPQITAKARRNPSAVCRRFP